MRRCPDGTVSQNESSTPTFFDKIGRPRWIVAPMVDQSELPFRLLTRRYGAQLCFTPMVNSNQFVKSVTYRQEILNEARPEDRPLIVQFAGHDPSTLLQAARYVEHMCDAVDLNLGCPQGIARRGRYGAYLLEEEDLVVHIVQALSSKLSIPVTCKIRLFRDDLDRTLRLCQRLQDAGCSMLTVHGRTRYQNKETVGECNWEAIAAVKAAIRIPVIANGGIASFSDLHNCMRVTGVDGVMSSEAVLENPALFANNRDASGVYVDQNRLAKEYLDLVQFCGMQGERNGCPKFVMSHVFKLLHAGLQENHDLRDRVSAAKTFWEYSDIVAELAERGWSQPGLNHPALCLKERSWYYRHRIVPQSQAIGHHQCTPKTHISVQGDVHVEEEEDATCWQALIFDDRS
eukprot:TRINITY_DN26520_c0_g1_i1.p1 TRINITY_DN26520_c0_g1~~TRINITY_DN26520_c0_g1_i1.p1  ORF type:complete len:402 (-),score=44.36 TRINITY_DN26520_c0_g1_i1:203-1408(-)